MAKRKENMFAGKARRSMDKPTNSFGYLKVPDDVEILKPEPDTEIIVDVIPYIVSDDSHMDNKVHEDVAIVGDPHWKRPLKVHKSVGPDNMSLICPTTVGKKCPICEYFTKRKRAGDDFDDIRDYLPSNRTIYVVVVIDAQELEVDYKEGEIYVMEQPDHYFGKALQSALDKDITAEGFADPEQGLALQVDFRTGKFGKVKYAEAIKVRFLDREEQYDDGIMDEAPDLDAMMKILSYKEIDALFYGDMEGVQDEDVDDRQLAEADEAPRRKRERKTSERSTRERSSRRSRDDEPEAEEKTTRRRKPKEEPDPEPDAEEKTIRSRSRKKPKEDEEPAAEEKTTRRRKPKEEKEPEAEEKTTRKREPEGPECPFDHRFGKDHDEFEDCDKCKVWEDCRDAR